MHESGLRYSTSTCKVSDAWSVHMGKCATCTCTCNMQVMMCVLKRRLLGAPARIPVDWAKCAIECGDGKWVELRHAYHTV